MYEYSAHLLCYLTSKTGPHAKMSPQILEVFYYTVAHLVLHINNLMPVVFIIIFTFKDKNKVYGRLFYMVELPKGMNLRLCVLRSESQESFHY